MDRSFSATRAYDLKMEKFLQTIFACVFILSIVQVNGYSKYGRTCKDIGCLSTERCVMIPECDTTENKCGYPTCEKNTNTKQTCETKTCGGGQHCEYVNARPTCINDASATVRGPNGERRQPAPPPFSRRPSGRYTAGNRGNSKGGFPTPNDINDRYHGSRHGQPIAPRSTGNDYYKTHSSTDSKGNRQWTFSS